MFELPTQHHRVEGRALWARILRRDREQDLCSWRGASILRDDLPERGKPCALRSVCTVGVSRLGTQRPRSVVSLQPDRYGKRVLHPFRLSAGKAARLATVSSGDVATLLATTSVRASSVKSADLDSRLHQLHSRQGSRALEQGSGDFVGLWPIYCSSAHNSVFIGGVFGSGSWVHEGLGAAPVGTAGDAGHRGGVVVHGCGSRASGYEWAPVKLLTPRPPATGMKYWLIWYVSRCRYQRHKLSRTRLNP